MGAATSLPTSQNGITAQWLSAALARKFPGVEVTSVHFGTVIHGTTTKIRLLLNYNEAGHSHRLPATMMAKCGFEVHSASPHVVECSRSEVIFYRDLAPEGLLNVAKCYFAGMDEKSSTSFLLLEDLQARNVSFGFALRPISLEVARQALAMVANFHARWWNSPGTPRPEITAGARLAADVWMGEDNFVLSSRLPRFEFVAPPLRDRVHFRRAIDKLWASNSRGPHTLLLGDFHLGNCFFDADGTPGFLDLQGDTLGCWAHDFTEFLMTALDIDVRRRCERELLQFYLTQLSSRGVAAPSFEDAWLQYRRNALWVATAAVCPVESQYEAVCSAYTQRAMTAVMDLDTLGALDA